MRVLIAFATVEGQTGKIARFAAEAVRRAGGEAVLADTDEAEQIDLGGADRVILAGPVHERRHPASLEAFIAASRKDLAKVPTLLLSVSMNAAFPEGQEAAQDYVVEMLMRTRFAPTREMLVAGAVRASSYDYYASQVVKHVVLRGHDEVAAGEDAEFTDWDALDRGVREFVAG